jgi:3-hydroxyisobutyrate dehydrogenase-like beta-hydroxyacid dehydrogenase
MAKARSKASHRIKLEETTSPQNPMSSINVTEEIIQQILEIYGQQVTLLTSRIALQKDKLAAQSAALAEKSALADQLLVDKTQLANDLAQKTAEVTALSVQLEAALQNDAADASAVQYAGQQLELAKAAQNQAERARLDADAALEAYKAQVEAAGESDNDEEREAELSAIQDKLQELLEKMNNAISPDLAAE